MSETIQTFTPAGDTSYRTIYVQPSERDDETVVHVDVVRYDMTVADGEPFHTELLLTADQARRLMRALAEAHDQGARFAPSDVTTEDQERGL